MGACRARAAEPHVGTARAAGLGGFAHQPPSGGPAGSYLGAPQPLPDEAALDGVDEFLSTWCAWASPWPHKPAAVDFHATEGRSWRLSLSADGARITRRATPGTMPVSVAGEEPDAAAASARGSASELVLALHGRTPLDSLELDGDRQVFDLLPAWEPE